MPILSALIVSVDAFFIGLSLGLQKKCTFIYLAIINIFLLGMCVLGFLLASRVYELIEIDTDIVVGFAFIGLGTWYILQYFIANLRTRRNGNQIGETSLKTIVLVGFVMSLEAMLITMGLSFIFGTVWLIPITVAVAHFVYSAISFHLVRLHRVRTIPAVVSHVVSGVSLIIYGLMAIFVEFGV